MIGDVSARAHRLVRRLALGEDRLGRREAGAARIAGAHERLDAVLGLALVGEADHFVGDHKVGAVVLLQPAAEAAARVEELGAHAVPDANAALDGGERPRLLEEEVDQYPHSSISTQAR